jgi:hypothetical protein
MKMEETVFRNVTTENSDAGKSPKERMHSVCTSPVKKEQTQFPEASGNKSQTPGSHPKLKCNIQNTAEV